MVVFGLIDLQSTKGIHDNIQERAIRGALANEQYLGDIPLPPGTIEDYFKDAKADAVSVHLLASRIITETGKTSIIINDMGVCRLKRSPGGGHPIILEEQRLLSKFDSDNLFRR